MRLDLLKFLLASTIWAAACSTALASPDAGAGDVSAWKIVVLVNGDRIAVREVAVRGGLVLITTREGRRQSVASSFVDWGATEQANRVVEPSVGGNAVAEDAPLVATLEPDALEGRTSSPSGALPAPVLPAPAPAGLVPPPPTPPAVIARDSHGNATLRAVRLDGPLAIDGLLEESIYQRVPAIGGFIQQEPHEGEPATERTETWFFFDEKNIYVAARMWDSHPERMVVNEMRRDNRNISNNENFAVIFDTFHDKRNGFLFSTNPLGALWEGQVTDESEVNGDWNTVWYVQTSRFAQGWAMEMAIPFKSLRYKEGESQIWGVNFRRIVKWKNEWSFLTPIAAAYRRQGLMKLSAAASIVGIEAPTRSRNLEVKPYVTSGVRTDLEADPVVSNDLKNDVGFDVKYGLTKGLIGDFTYNTDFAQVEDDEQQVNLTRFSLLFPEKREFFLEGQGIFSFGGVRTRGGDGGGGGGPEDTPIMFFSRRIGLTDEHAVPINVGGRVTGRAGKYSIGALAIQTGELAAESIPTTTFSVARVKRDILRRSNIGFIATHRSESVEADGANALLGLDANFSFFENLDVNAYYAVTHTPGLGQDDVSYLGKFDYGGDRYGLRLEHLVVGENFNPETGYVRRNDIRKSSAEVRFSPRPAFLKPVRKIDFQGRLDYIDDLNDHRLETRNVELEMRAEFNNSDVFNVTYARSFEYLDEEFDITDEVILPIGDYHFQEARVNYFFGRQRPVSGRVGFTKGSFYSGHRNELEWMGRVDLSEKLSFEPGVSFNWVNLPEGDFTTKLVRMRANYTFTPRTFLGALVQYNSSDDALSTNIRFRWEYQPGSDLFIVYSDGRDTSRPGFPSIQTRSFVVKFTRLFRF